MLLSMISASFMHIQQQNANHKHTFDTSILFAAYMNKNKYSSSIVINYHGNINKIC